MPAHEPTAPLSVLDLELPGIPDRDAYTPPPSHLVKAGANAWRVADGRRPSKTMLVNPIRQAVDAWRTANYPGVSDTTRRLFLYWFEDDHRLADGHPFRYYFCQREAVETLVYLYEIKGVRDTAALLQAFFVASDLLGLQIFTSRNGERFLRRYIPEINKDAEQELPPPGLPRYGVKMATGSGKTVVMAMVMTWSFFHRRREADSQLADHFLLVAPNIIVYERLRKDFAAGRIFRELPLVPPEWKHEFTLQSILRGEAADASAGGGALFLTNIQQIYEDTAPPPINPIAAILGNAPKQNATVTESMLDRIKRAPNLMVLNDEAHHVHDDDLAWNQTLLALHANLQAKSAGGLTLWLDFSATPKNQNGTFYPWLVVDYPLAQAVEDRIVKTPLIIHQTDKHDPDKYAHTEAGDAYSEWITIAMQRWRQHTADYGTVGEKPLLFVMAENTKDADSITERLRLEPELKDKGRVLLIHTDKAGEISTKDLEVAREAARQVDEGKSKIRAIVSVMMLREGWDVRNVSVILGLRPFSAKANILPEQAVGRGLRLMRNVPRDNNQVLELIGTNAFETFIKELEGEGVGIATVTRPPKPGELIHPLPERQAFNIQIPQTTPLYEREYRNLDKLDPLALPPLASEKDLDPQVKNRIDLLHSIVDVKVGSDDVEFNADNLPPIANLMGSLTNRVEKKARLTGCFANLYPKVKLYVQRRCFGGTVEIEEAAVRRALNHSDLLDAVAGLFSRAIGDLTATPQPVKLVGERISLDGTSPFRWRRMAVDAEKTVFNRVACFNEFEARFAQYLDGCQDVERFAALSEWFTHFCVQYLSESGAIRMYYPDFVAEQASPDGVVHWILETKGREFTDTDTKAEHMRRWCAEVKQETGEDWRYLKVSQPVFYDFLKRGNIRSLHALTTWKTTMPSPQQQLGLDEERYPTKRSCTRRAPGPGGAE